MKFRRKFDAVVFDCDSTLSRIEGIDELARRAGCEAEIARLTNAAMDGLIPLDQVYGKRLDAVRPDRASMAWLAERYSEDIVNGAAETIAALKDNGTAVYVVSGGLLAGVAPFALTLGIDAAHVYAVDMTFSSNGDYVAFDADSPLTRNDGKAVMCRVISERHGSVAIVGDGITDLAARDAGAYVVGFGGVVRRAAVEKAADHYITSPDLTATLAALLTDKE